MMSEKRKSSKLYRRIIGALLFILIAVVVYFSMPILTALAVNSFYITMLGLLVIGIGYLIYYLMK
jgi:hypothetical protein